MFMKFIIPCYNVGNTIGRMLDSILTQTFTDYHIVCVEDCSTDNTWDVLQSYKGKNPDKMTLIKNPYNMGPGETRNRGYFMTTDSLPSEFIWMIGRTPSRVPIVPASPETRPLCLKKRRSSAKK